MHINQRYANAFDYAMRVHAARPRRGSTLPASVHLMAVSALVFEHGGDEDQALAALLHDVVEVGGAVHASPINRQFGARVLRLVLDCSEGLGQPPADHLLDDRGHLLVADRLPGGDAVVARRAEVGRGVDELDRLRQPRTLRGPDLDAVLDDRHERRQALRR